MATETKIIVFLLALLGLGILAWVVKDRIYDSGVTAGKATIQLAWDQNKAEIQKTADDAIAAATKQRDDALSANEGIQSDYQTQLTSARALNGSLADRLRQYEARAAANSGTVPKAGGGQGPPAAGAAPSVGRFDDLVGAAFGECASNSIQLNALIKELGPQL